MCKGMFFNVGDVIQLNISSGKCPYCQEQINFSGLATWEGHTMNGMAAYDTYGLKGQCRNCNKELVAYQELCSDHPILMVLQENPQN